MSKTINYMVKADGWVAGKWRARGAVIKLTTTAAKYENVSLVIIGIDLAKGESETVTEEAAPKAPRRKSRKK